MKILSLFLLILLASCQRDTQGQTDNAHLPAQSMMDVSYGSDTAQKMDIYLPAGRTTDTTKMIVMVHGGAWSSGDKADFLSYVAVLQQRLPNYAIANINYRLATTAANHFPTQENDMKAAMDFLTAHATGYHISQNFVLLGASSGAHMALLQAYKYATPRIKAVVDFFGPTDMAGMFNDAGAGSITQLGIQILMSGTPSNNASLYESSSPLHFVSAQSPPTIILHGDHDDVVNISQSIALKNALQARGVVNEMDTYPGQGHGIWPSAVMEDAFNKIEQFIRVNVR